MLLFTRLTIFHQDFIFTPVYHTHPLFFSFQVSFLLKKNVLLICHLSCCFFSSNQLLFSNILVRQDDSNSYWTQKQPCFEACFVTPSSKKLWNANKFQDKYQTVGLINFKHKQSGKSRAESIEVRRPSMATQAQQQIWLDVGLGVSVWKQVWCLVTGGITGMCSIASLSCSLNMLGPAEGLSLSRMPCCHLIYNTKVPAACAPSAPREAVAQLRGRRTAQLPHMGVTFNPALPLISQQCSASVLPRMEVNLSRTPCWWQ